MANENEIFDKDYTDEELKEIAATLDFDEADFEVMQLSNPEYRKQNSAVMKLARKYKANPTPELRMKLMTDLTLLLSNLIDSLINHTTYKNKREDSKQQCCLAIVEHVDGYDPDKGAPSTYFRTYFLQAIGVVTQDETNRKKSSYFQNLIRRVNDAEKECVLRELEPSLTNLSLKSGLPIKQVSTAKKLINFRNRLSLDADGMDAYVDQKKKTDPQQLFLDKERSESVEKALRECCNDEIEIMIYKMFRGIPINEKAEEKAYTPSAIAVILKKAYPGRAFYPQQIESIISKIDLKMRNNKSLAAYSGRSKYRQFRNQGGKKMFFSEKSDNIADLYMFDED